MDRASYRRIDAVFCRLIDESPEQRPALLERFWSHDPELREAVAALLRADGLTDPFLEHPAFDAGSQPMPQPVGPCSQGDLLSNHRILRLLGSGGMGHVYLAEDLRLNRKVALKVLTAKPADPSAADRAFLREARLASRLNHPNLCTIYETGEADGLRFISMQYIAGRTIREELRREGRPFSIRKACMVGLQVARALEAAHQDGIVHGDLTAGNVMVDADDWVQVLDFGIARRLDAAWSSTEGKLPEHTRLGTPAYMSPEQIRGEPLDYRTDVFSFCVLMYEMLTGSSPFRRETRLGTLAAVCYEAPESLARANPAVPGALAELIEAGLRKSPDDRPASVEALIEGLEQTLQHMARTTRPRSHAAVGPSAVVKITVLLLGFVLFSLRGPDVATRDAEAHQLYLRGRYHADQGSPSSAARAAGYFDQAVAADPGFAAAWAALANAHLALARGDPSRAQRSYASAQAAATKALGIDPSLAQAHVSLALIAEGRDWDWQAARNHYEAAVTLAPSDAEALRYYARFLAAMGDTEDAVAAAKRAVALSPASLSVIATYGFALYMAGRNEEALDQMNTALEMNPDFGEAHFLSGLALYGRGDYGAAVRALEKARQLTRRFYGPLGLAYVQEGRAQEARALLRELQHLERSRPVPGIEIAILHLALGEIDAAFERLGTMVDRREWNVHILKAAPQLGPLRADPRYRHLLNRTGLTDVAPALASGTDQGPQ